MPISSVLDPAIAQKLMHYVSGQRPSPPDYEPLTDRELEVLALAGKEYTNKAIGMQLGISDRTVQGHLAKTYSKLQANICLNNLGVLLKELGNPKAAATYYQKALFIWERTADSHHPNTIAILANLGLAYQEQGRWGLAKIYLEQSIKRTKTSYGAEHP